MDTPRIRDIELTTIYGEELKAKLIPLSIKASMDIENSIEDIKEEMQTKREGRLKRLKRALTDENQTDEELQDAYIEGKITIDLNKAGQEITDERVKRHKLKRKDKLIGNKTREDLINELATIASDLEERKQMLYGTVCKTLWNILRNPDNLREKIFGTVDELEESLDQEMLFEVFNQKVDENKVEDDDLKN